MTLIVPRPIAARWRGAGDVIATVANPVKRLPVVKALLKNCRCEQRQEKANRILTFASN